MASTLETVVGQVITRVVLMESAALSLSSRATKHWYFLPAGNQFPYWTNRPGTLVTLEYNRKFRLDIQARLWLAHVSQLNAGAAPVETSVWSYIPQVFNYFTQYRQLDMPDQSEIAYVGPEGVTITNDAGTETGILPYGSGEYLYADFTIQVPLLILG